MAFEHFSKNGQVLPIDNAVISISNIEYSYGYGVYESIKIRNGIIYFQSQHIKRLLNSAIIIGLEHHFTEAEVLRYISELLEKEKIESANLKIVLLGGKTKSAAQLFITPLSPLFLDRKLYSVGAKTITTRYERLFPGAKTLNMLGSYLAYKNARNQNCYDSLLLDSNKNINEGTRTNFFVMKNNTIFSPHSEKILEGVTRLTVLHVAKNMGFGIKENDITTKDLSNYDGAFLTSTSAKILPIKQIDEFVFQTIPDSLKSLMREYDQFLKNSKGIFNEAE